MIRKPESESSLGKRESERDNSPTSPGVGFFIIKHRKGEVFLITERRECDNFGIWDFDITQSHLDGASEKVF